MFGIRKKAATTAKRAGLLTGGLLLCAVGVAFLTLAAWLALVPIIGSQLTATILAAAYLGVGLIVIGMNVRRDEPAHQAQQPDKSKPVDGPPIVQAFMYGLQAGAHSDQTRH